MKVRKELLRLGKHHARGGMLDATQDWADRKIEQANKLIAKGVRLPFAWGHAKKALPLDPEDAKDERQFEASKFNAGYIERLERLGDRIFVEGEIPAVKRIDDAGNLIHDVEIEGKKTEAAISEVSAGFDTWIDGQGDKHDDCLIHVALCTHPIYAGQSGFAVAEENRPPILLSASTWFGASDAIGSTDTRVRKTLAAEPDMADELKDKKDEKPGDDKPESKDKADKKPDESTEEDKPKEGEGPGKAVPDMMKEIGEIFKIGLPEQLPSDHKAALEMLYIAACASKPPQEEELKMANQPNNSTGAIMLSAALKGNDWTAAVAKSLDSSTREGLKKRIEALKARGLSEQDQKDFLEMLPRLELSVDPTSGQVQDTDLHKSLTILERNLPTRKELAADSELTEHAPPVHDPKEKAKKTLEELEKNGVIAPEKK